MFCTRLFALTLAAVFIPALGGLGQIPKTQPLEGIRDVGNKTIAIEGAQVMTRRGQLEEITLLIQNGKIVDMGTKIEVPLGTKRVSLPGQFIYPAWIEPYAEIELPLPTRDAGAGYWNNSVAAQRSVAHQYAANEERIKKFRKAGCGSILLAPSNGVIKGQSCIVSTGSGNGSETILKPNAMMHVVLGLAARTRGSGYPNSPMGAVALARQAFLDAQWYQKSWQSIQANPSLPQPEKSDALAALDDVLTSNQKVMIDALNEQSFLRADQFAREFALNAIIRGSGREYRMLDSISKTKRSIIVPLNFPKAPNVSSMELASQASLQDLAHWELAPENAGRLDKEGVVFAVTSMGLDDPNEIMTRIREAVERGLNPTSGLDAMTKVPAQLLGIDHWTGSIETGKLASLMVFDGDLWNKKSKLTETWVAGERFQWNEQPTKDLTGQWNIEIVQGFTKGSSWSLKISNDKKLKGTLNRVPTVAQSNLDQNQVEEPPAPDGATDSQKTKPSEVNLLQLKQSDLRITANFDAEALKLEQKGRAQLSLTLVSSSDANDQLRGEIAWSDGSTSVLVVTRPPAATREAATQSDKKAVRKSEDHQQVISDIRFPLGEYGRKGLPAQPRAILIQNATVWTSGPRGTLKETDVLIEAGILKKIGQDLTAPEGAWIIDAQGKHVSPGIIDCHSHMATDGGVNESGQAVTAEVRIGDFIDANDITIYHQLAGGVTSANVLHGSANPIGGQNQVIKLRWGGIYDELKMKEAPAGIKFALGENVKQSNSGAEATGRYPQSRMGVEQLMRDRFEAAREYQSEWKSWNESSRGLPPRRDLELEAISQILNGQRWIHCHSYRQDEILAMLRTLEDYNVQVGSLQHILEGYKVAEVMAKHGAAGSSFSDWWGYKFEVIDAIPFNGALMHNMGIVVSFNSDDNELGRHLNHEAAKAMKYGNVPPEEAIKFVTLNPAKQLRIDSWVGSLEEGKQADFVIWSGSPLSIYSRCEQTWIDGRKYFDKDQDLADREYISTTRRRLIQKVLALDSPMGEPGEKPFDPSLLWPRHDEFCHHSEDETKRLHMHQHQ